MSEKIILTIDALPLDKGLRLVEKASAQIYGVKVHNHCDGEGPVVVQRLFEKGVRQVWVDYKLYETPDSVKLRASAIAKCGANMLTVHAAGGPEMIRAAVENFPGEVLVVTFLTTMSKPQIFELYGQPFGAVLRRFAGFAKKGGARAIVCSAEEARILKVGHEFREMKFIVPGIRDEGEDRHDQRRTSTVIEAIQADATHIVVGRKITYARDPLLALKRLEEEIAQAAFVR